MNEKGLAVALLYMEDTVYPQIDDKKPCIYYTYWAQYVLDNANSVEDAIDKMKQVNLVPVEIDGRIWPMHMVLADSTGNSAVIEFIDAKGMVIHHDSVLQYRVMTNEPDYDTQIANLKDYNLCLPLNESLLKSDDSISRFVKASAFLKQEAPKGVNDIMNIMKRISVKHTGHFDPEIDEWPTLWISQYNLRQKKFYFSSVDVGESREVKVNNRFEIDLSKIDFKNGNILILENPYNKNLNGNVTGELRIINRMSDLR